MCSGSFAGLGVIFDAATIYAVLVKHANAAQFVLKVLFCSIAMRELYICIKAAIWYINISSSLDYCFNKQKGVLSISSLSIAAMTGRFNLLTDWLTDWLPFIKTWQNARSAIYNRLNTDIVSILPVIRSKSEFAHPKISYLLSLSARNTRHGTDKVRAACKIWGKSIIGLRTMSFDNALIKRKNRNRKLHFFEI